MNAPEAKNAPEARKIPRPLPKPNVYMDTAPFWDAAKEHRLVIQKCPRTGQFQFFPRPGSVFSGRRDTEWTEVSGNGTLYSWTLTRSAWPGHEDRVPYICAYVDLAEGVRILCNLFNADPETVQIGMPVKLMWEELPNGQPYPAFEPA
jgi:uncharacterized OB-fold protein